MKTYPTLFLFAGCGGQALGALRARSEFRGTKASFTYAGAVDNDPIACLAFEQLTGHPCTQADIGAMGEEDLRRACPVPPAAVWLSPPCQGNSGCLPASMAETPKYQEMNDLAVTSLFLTIETYRESPPRLILLENVPRIRTRSKPLLERIVAMLRSYGYDCAQTVHDCGELGGLGQRRNRYLLVARHMASTGNWWRVPPKKKHRSIGDVIGSLPVPLPGSTEGRSMHRLPRLSAMNWTRLALIRAGKDWRDLPPEVRLEVRDGRQNGGFGVNAWAEPSHTVVAQADVRNTWGSVQDPRTCDMRAGGEGVGQWGEPSVTITGAAQHDNGAFSVAAPRLSDRPGRHEAKLRIEDWEQTGHTVIGTDRIGSGAPSIADPRLGDIEGRYRGGHAVGPWTEPAATVIGASDAANGAVVADPRLSERGNPSTDTTARHKGKLGVEPWDEPSHTIISSASPQLGHGAVVADPRVGSMRREGGHGVTRWDRPICTVIGQPEVVNGPWQTADPRLTCENRRGALRVIRWGEVAPTIIGAATSYQGFNVADPRPMKAPPIIIADDGTWHRPLTTLELGALQDLPVRDRSGAWLVLPGTQEQQRRLIGNCVPPGAAEAMATTALRCLLVSDADVVELSCDPVWVGPGAEALDA